MRSRERQNVHVWHSGILAVKKGRGELFRLFGRPQPMYHVRLGALKVEGSD